MTFIKVKAIGKRFGQKVSALDQISFDVQQGELVALAGESGSGKTTLLRLLAGLETPDQGSIEIDGAIVAGTGQFMEPAQRAVGLVFQDYALFPHMTVSQNTTFGLQGWSKKEKQVRCQEVLHLVGLEGLEERFPHQLSGGQQQRVAIARALAPKPKILLLDEPFSNLDTSLKDQVRAEVKNIIKKSRITAILVTHDIADALSTADRIALLKAGTLQQLDTPQKLYREPRNQYVAGFFGKMNLLSAHYDGNCLHTDICEIPTQQPPAISKGILCLRPQDITVTTSPPGIAAKIVDVQYLGSQQQLQVQVANQLLWCQTNFFDLNADQEVYLTIDLKEVHLIKK